MSSENFFCTKLKKHLHNQTRDFSAVLAAITMRMNEVFILTECRGFKQFLSHNMHTTLKPQTVWTTQTGSGRWNPAKHCLMVWFCTDTPYLNCYRHQYDRQELHDSTLVPWPLRRQITTWFTVKESRSAFFSSSQWQNLSYLNLVLAHGALFPGLLSESSQIYPRQTSMKQQCYEVWGPKCAVFPQSH